MKKHLMGRGKRATVFSSNELLKTKAFLAVEAEF
jgi:hypothetical protein